MALDPSTGAIFGTDSAAIGSFTFGAAAVDSSANAAAKALNNCMLVAAAPVLTMVAGPNTTPQNVVVNTALGTPLAVVVTDAGGNPVKGASVTFTVTIGPGNIPSGVFTGGDNNNLNTLNSVIVDTDAKGVATAPAFTANKIRGGPYNVRASTPNAKNSVTFKVTNIAGPPFAIKVTGGGGQTAQVGAQFAKPLTAQVTDQFGNDVPKVPVAFSAPALPAAGSTFGNPPAAAATVNTDKNGNVSLVATANTAVGGYNITATVGKVAPVTFAMTNIAGNPAKIVPILPTNDPTVQNGMFYATVNTKYSPLVVQVVDQFGNPLNGQKVTFTISNVNVANPGGEFTTNANFPGTLKTCTATTGNNGQATAATITANRVAGGFTVTASLAANGKISTVFNLVNKGKVNVPNVVGSTQAAATTAINKALLNVGNVTTAKSNTVPAGSVISTTPGAGAAVNVGSAVDLVVSSGK